VERETDDRGCHPQRNALLVSTTKGESKMSRITINTLASVEPLNGQVMATTTGGFLGWPMRRWLVRRVPVRVVPRARCVWARLPPFFQLRRICVPVLF
jgi:hypothetical protein